MVLAMALTILTITADRNFGCAERVTDLPSSAFADGFVSSSNCRICTTCKKSGTRHNPGKHGPANDPQARVEEHFDANRHHHG
jgi:hypothetical protein